MDLNVMNVVLNVVCVASSDEDLDIILHGTLEQRKQLRRRRTGGKLSSEDEFEKELNAELNFTMKKLGASCTSIAKGIYRLVIAINSCFWSLMAPRFLFRC
jgi:hypothetical protein